MKKLIKQFTKIFAKNTNVIKEETKQESVNLVSIEQLFNAITSHPECNKSTQVLLGITFTHYQINENDLSIFVETNGNENEKILEIKIIKQKNVVYSYFSYEESDSINHKIKLEDGIYQLLF